MTFRSGLGAAAAAVALAFLACGAIAQAQEKKAEPAAKTAKPKSVCNSITEEAACKANATCAWVAALMDAKTGKQKRKAYCRTKPKPPTKKKETAKEPAKK
jgi:hypothetical protein